MGQVDPNLVGSAGFEPQFQKACDRLPRGPVPLHHLPMGDGFATTLSDGHLVPSMRVPGNWGLDRAPRSFRRAPGKTPIDASERSGPSVIGELV